MLAALYTPPDLPPVLGWMVFGVIIVAGILAGAWRGFLWLRDRFKEWLTETFDSKGFEARLDGRFIAAIQSREFEAVVDRRVAAAFDGATRPLTQAQNDLAGRIGEVKATAEKAHERIDKHLEHHQDGKGTARGPS